MKTVLKVVVLGIILLGPSSCGTIVGGSKYYARIIVPNRPNATIKHEGMVMGSGSAVIPMNRSKANAFTLTVKEDGYDEQEFKFTQRKFRGWAFVGTIIGWTGVSGGVPLPWGVVVDLSDGSLWKPSIAEKGVSKMDMKNYLYTLDYKAAKSVVIVSK